jgi:hypothetical protein
LKGAARPALEVYAPKSEPKERKNLLAENRGKLWEVPDGKEYLTAMSEYATALNNLMNKSREAVAIFEEMLELDLEDHMVSCPVSSCLMSIHSMQLIREQKSNCCDVI